jgi:regulator of chromosome condensation
MALTRGGILLSWGTGQQGQLGRVGSRLPERTLKETLLRPHPVPLRKRIRGIGTPKITDFACGTYTSFAIAEGGHVFAWGLNNYGQLALPGQVHLHPDPLFPPGLYYACYWSCPFTGPSTQCSCMLRKE